LDILVIYWPFGPGPERLWAGSVAPTGGRRGCHAIRLCLGQASTCIPPLLRKVRPQRLRPRLHRRHRRSLLPLLRYCQRSRRRALAWEKPSLPGTVHVILNPKVALLGAACHGLELLGSVDAAKHATARLCSSQDFIKAHVTTQALFVCHSERA
jgi:hypothetical protein